MGFKNYIELQKAVLENKELRTKPTYFDPSKKKGWVLVNED